MSNHRGVARAGYQQIGRPDGVDTTVSRVAFSRGVTGTMIAAIVLSVLAAALVGVALYFGLTAWSDNKGQSDLLVAQASALATETFDRMAGDATLQAEVDDRLASLNGVHGDNATHNVNLEVNGTGFSVTPDPDAHRVLLHNEAVLNMNGVFPTLTDGSLFLDATGMLEIDLTPENSTLTVNATAIVASLSNLQAQVSMQQIEILELQQNDTSVQTIVDAIVNALAAFGNSSDLNATLVQLVTDVAMATTNIAALQQQVANLTMNEPMPGMLVPWAGADGGPVPAGWLLCDGTEYDITDYPALYAVIGTMYCGGPCSNLSVFAVPDMRGRMPVHKGGTVLNAAIGTQVGAETHTLTTGEMPLHSHTGTTNTDGDHVHIWSVKRSSDGDDPASPSVCVDAGIFREFNNLGTVDCGWDPTPGLNSYTGLRTDGLNSYGAEASGGLAPPNSPIHAHAFTSNSAGSGNAHPNVQPSLVMQYIIKT